MQLSWNALSERERRLVMMGAVLGVLVLLFGILLPIDHNVSRAHARIGQKQMDLAWMRSVAPELAALPQAHSPVGQESLIVIVDRSARESGLGSALAGSEPSTAGGLQVRMEKAPFDALVGWLARLAQQNGLRVDGATIDNAGAPGMVNAAIVLRAR
jgi:type II secretory pathway component PulM